MKTTKLFNSPLLNVLIFSGSWALNIFFTKYAFNQGDEPTVFLVQSTLVFAIIMLVVFLPFTYKEIIKLSPKFLGIVILINIIHYGLGVNLNNLGTAMVSGVSVGFLNKSATLWIIFFAAIFLNEKLTRTKTLTVIVMFIGLFLLVTNGSIGNVGTGEIIVLISTSFWGIANTLVRKYLKDGQVSPNTMVLFRPIIGLLFIMIMIWGNNYLPGVIQEDYEVDIFAKTNAFLVILTGITSALVALFLSRTLKFASASYMTMMSMITPVLTAILSVAFLNEKISVMQLFGGGLIIVSGVVTHKLKIQNQ